MIIPVSKIFIDYNESKRILKSLEFSFIEEKEKSTTLRKSDFSREFIKQSYKGNYIDMYRKARENLDYNLLLTEDGSFFQFGFELDSEEKVSEIRYAYYEAPSFIISYEEYLAENGLSYNECGAMFFEEYSQFISEAELKNNVTSIRYDFSINQRRELIHPASHIHIGQGNDIRIPISFVMTPKHFVAFIVRQIYWNKWRIAMDDEKLRENYLSCFSTGGLISDLLFSRDEKRDLHLSYR